MDLKKLKNKQRTGGYRNKVHKVYKNMQKLGKTTGCEKSVDKILLNFTHFLETNKNNAPSSSSIAIREGSVDFSSQICNNGEVTEEKHFLEPNENNAPSSSSIAISEGPVDFSSQSSNNGEVTEEKYNYSYSDSDSGHNIQLDDVDHVRKSSYREQVRIWALKHNCSHASLKDLFRIINKFTPNAMPQDPRSLLCTPRDVEIKIVEPGTYWHNNNFKNYIEKILETYGNALDNISILINIDGVPIYKSSKQQFWPILCSIHEFPRLSPIICGIYQGLAKPKDLHEFMKDFIEEMGNMLQNGIILQNRKISVSLKCFVCDSPARAMIKGVCNYNGKHGCLKCTVVGEYSHVSHTVIFPDINCPLRKNNDFRGKKYGNHHKFDSPLLTLPIDMVEQFPVSDSLHLIDLGVVKRLIVGWRDGNFGKKTTKWCSSDIQIVNNFLNSCKTPTEIHRAVRGLDSLCHWKGSEFRTFFHYLSVAILPKVLKTDAAQHFLSLYCAITICSNEEYFPLLSLAEKLLEYFTVHYKDFYGLDYVTSNVHNLTHIVDEVRRFGTLQSYNAYKFENKLYQIKKLLRQGNKPLPQIAKRLKEHEFFDYEQFIVQAQINYPYIKKHRKNLVLHFNGFILSNQSADKYFLTAKKEVMEVTNIKIKESKIYIHSKKFSNLLNAFDLPIFSSYLNIFKCNVNSVLDSEYVCLPCDVKCKLVVTQYDENIYFVPLLHTL